MTSLEYENNKSTGNTVTSLHESDDVSSFGRRKSLRQRILGTLWDSLDKSPEERKLIAKVDWWILTYVCIAYFVKYLDQTNVGRLSLCYLILP